MEMLPGKKSSETLPTSEFSVIESWSKMDLSYYPVPSLVLRLALQAAEDLDSHIVSKRTRLDVERRNGGRGVEESPGGVESTGEVLSLGT